MCKRISQRKAETFPTVPVIHGNEARIDDTSKATKGDATKVVEATNNEEESTGKITELKKVAAKKLTEAKTFKFSGDLQDFAAFSYKFIIS